MIVYSDSQAAHKAVARPRQQSGQFILHKILSEIDEIRRWAGVEVEFRWVPALVGVTPNEVGSRDLSPGHSRKQKATTDPLTETGDNGTTGSQAIGCMRNHGQSRPDIFPAPYRPGPAAT